MSKFSQHLAQHRDVTHPGQWISLRGQQRFKERHQHAGFQHASRLQEMYRNHMYHIYIGSQGWGFPGASRNPQSCHVLYMWL